MNKRIMVPLDGSQLAEKALPYAIKLANQINGSLLLVHVLETPGPGPQEYSFQGDTFPVNSADPYLQEVSRIISGPGAEPWIEADRLEIIVGYGKPAVALATMIEDEQVDLVVMTSHGRTGLSRLVMGSVAFDLVQRSICPIMLIQPEKPNEFSLLADTLARRTSLHFNDGEQPRIILTLDGSSEAETVIEPAIQLASQLKGVIHLVRIVPPTIQIDYDNTPEEYGNYSNNDLEKTRRHHRKEVYEYMDRIAEQINDRGVHCVRVVLLGSYAEKILDYACQIQANMLAMAIHARGKFGQVLIGSLGEEVMRRSHLPVIMVNGRALLEAQQTQAEKPEMLSR
ncbi:MAG TPA: universal stress protein [Chloroflexia bacterium]|nr:universal stress protein [Chloroflexia bacterium]